MKNSTCEALLMRTLFSEQPDDSWLVLDALTQDLADHGVEPSAAMHPLDAELTLIARLIPTMTQQEQADNLARLVSMFEALKKE